MPLKPFAFPEDIRFLGYLDCVYKFNIHFSSRMKASHVAQVQDDIELAINHILIGIPKCIKSIRTKTVTVSYRTRKWNCNQSFYQDDGRKLTPFSHSFKLFICFNDHATPCDSAMLNTNEMNSFNCKQSSKRKRSRLETEVDVEKVSPSLPAISIRARLDCEEEAEKNSFVQCKEPQKKCAREEQSDSKRDVCQAVIEKSSCSSESTETKENASEEKQSGAVGTEAKSSCMIL